MSASPAKKGGPRFVKAFTAILRDPRLKPVDKCVLWCIKSYRNADDWCIPAVETVGADLGINRDTVHLSLNRLESFGILKRQPRFERGNRTSSLYLLQDDHFAKHCAQKGVSEKRDSYVVPEIRHK